MLPQIDAQSRGLQGREGIAIRRDDQDILWAIGPFASTVMLRQRTAVVMHLMWIFHHTCPAYCVSVMDISCLMRTRTSWMLSLGVPSVPE